MSHDVISFHLFIGTLYQVVSLFSFWFGGGGGGWGRGHAIPGYLKDTKIGLYKSAKMLHLIIHNSILFPANLFLASRI